MLFLSFLLFIKKRIIGGFYKLLESDWNGLLSRFWFNLAEAVAGYDSAS